MNIINVFGLFPVDEAAPFQVDFAEELIEGFFSGPIEGVSARLGVRISEPPSDEILELKEESMIVVDSQPEAEASTAETSTPDSRTVIELAADDPQALSHVLVLEQNPVEHDRRSASNMSETVMCGEEVPDLIEALMTDDSQSRDGVHSSVIEEWPPSDWHSEAEDNVASVSELELNARMPDDHYVGARLGESWGEGECWNLLSVVPRYRFATGWLPDKNKWPERRYRNAVDNRPSYEYVGSSKKRYYRIDTICQKVKALWPKTTPPHRALYILRWVGWDDRFNSLEPRKNIRDDAFAVYERRLSGIVTGSTGTFGNGWAMSGDYDASVSPHPSLNVNGSFDFLEKAIDEIEERSGVTGVRLCGVGW